QKSPAKTSIVMRGVHDAEKLLVTDPLTKLYNRICFAAMLRRDVKRAVRRGSHLSLIFISLEGFNQILETHGDRWGDRALVEAAAVIRSSAYTNHCVFYLDDNDFAITLPDADGAFAMTVAERARARIAAHTFLTADGLDVRLTAAVGVATLPDDAES